MSGMDDDLMEGAPPPPDRQVTLANWREAGYSRWAFHNVRELIPTAAIRGGVPRPFERADAPLASVAFQDADGQERTFGSVMDTTWTTGLIVLQAGRVVTESHDPAYGIERPHIVFSISKSITALLAGVLEDRGFLNPDAPVVHYVPEAEDSAYGDCTVRHVLDMTVSCTFEEVYLDPSGDYAQYRAATGWNPPLGDGWVNPGQRAFLLTLKRASHHHGTVHTYLSPNSDLLGWILERAAGDRFADLLSRHIWRPMGAEASASITLDHLGAPRTAGGISVHLRDLARIGEMMRLQGRAGDQRILPKAWVRDTLEVRNDAAWARGEMKSLFPKGGYRNKWYQTGNPSSAFCAIGIHGQWLYVDPAAEVVIARTAAQPEPVDEALDHVHLAAFDAVARHLEVSR